MKILLRIALAIAVVAGVVKWRAWRAWWETRNTPQLTREHSNSLVFVEGKAGAGTGFVCDIGGKKFVVTNQHVVDNAESITVSISLSLYQAVRYGTFS